MIVKQESDKVVVLFDGTDRRIEISMSEATQLRDDLTTLFIRKDVLEEVATWMNNEGQALRAEGLIEEGHTLQDRAKYVKAGDLT